MTTKYYEPKHFQLPTDVDEKVKRYMQDSGQGSILLSWRGECLFVKLIDGATCTDQEPGYHDRLVIEPMPMLIKLVELGN